MCLPSSASWFPAPSKRAVYEHGPRLVVTLLPDVRGRDSNPDPPRGWGLYL